MSLTPSLPGGLRTVVADLESLNRATEAGFLAVGGKLMEFHTGSRTLHAGIAALTALVTGEQSQNACDNLLSVRRYAEQMRTRSEKSGEALRLLETSAECIRQGFSGFDSIAMSFRITAVLARMETAHLSSSHGNLKNLADDVGACSEVIHTCAGKVLGATADFHSRLASTLPAVARFEAIQQNELPALLNAVDADVELFKDRQRQTARTSAGLADTLDAVARDLGALAGSLQFHDITRQQIEHVITALNEAILSYPASSAAHIRLQKAQLENAATSFLRSTREIDRDLESLAARVAEMAETGSAITRLNNEGATGNHSFLADMQRRFAAVVKTVSELESLERATHSIVADLERTGGGLRGAVAQVHSVEQQLGLISINAVISAAQVGHQGDSLKVIAESIRALRAESVSRSRQAGASLDAIFSAIASLADSARDEAAIPDLEASAAHLESAVSDGARAAAKVASLAEALCADLQNARRHLAVGQLFSDTAARCSETLQTIAAQAPDAGVSSLLALEHATERLYTMESERDVHRSQTGLGVPADAQDGAQEETEVEFF